MSKPIRVQNLTKRFGRFEAVRDVTFTAEAGSITALLGPSGSGKSTVLRMIAGLETPTRGRIWLGDEEQTHKSVQERRVGFVFQHYALFRHMSVWENVRFGLAVRRVPKREQRVRVEELLDLVQLGPFRDRYPEQLSGGQRQRVALARALAPRPNVLLLDEPFGALDAWVRQDLRRWLDDLHRELGVTSVLVTHDQDEALELANKVVVMHEGRIEQAGTPNEIYHEPATAFVAGFVGSANVLRGHVVAGHVQVGGHRIPIANDVGDGIDAHVFVRPHDVRLGPRDNGGATVRATVERMTTLGWLSRVALRLADGQVVTAELPSDELSDVGLGNEVTVRLRRARAFRASHVVGVEEPANDRPKGHPDA